MGQGGPTARIRARGRVLIVDDDADLRDALRATLEDGGYDVVVAKNGQEAIERFHAGAPPCVIVLDMLMPVMSGTEFLAERQKDPQLAKTPVVVVTATEVRSAAGEEAVMRKPVDLTLLLRRIESACGSSRRAGD
jgi:CheY-like chemotaxis protein